MIATVPGHTYPIVQENVRKATLCYNGASLGTTPVGFVAVYVSATDGKDERWIQLGILKYKGSPAKIYTETNDDQMGDQIVQLGTIKPGQCILAEIVNKGSGFQVRLNGKLVKWAYEWLAGPKFMAALEYYGSGNNAKVSIKP